jgi:hypothetical protein
MAGNFLLNLGGSMIPLFRMCIYWFAIGLLAYTLIGPKLETMPEVIAALSFFIAAALADLEDC